jgi:hypothetical protein
VVRAHRTMESQSPSKARVPAAPAGR